MHPARLGGLLATTIASLVLAAPAAHAGAPWQPFVDGAPGAGDDYFPFAGNGGYDASHYDLDLRYDFRTQLLEGDVTIEARATQNLRRFDLDLRGFGITRLKVDGRSAAFARAGDHELVITPRSGLRAGHRFTVAIEYAGVPEDVIDPDGSSEGWVKTADGAFVVNEPQGAPGWFPVNDDPNDKASFDFALAVPQGKTALANGVLVSSRTRKGWTTWRWRQRPPISPYLTTATNGDFTLTIDHLPDGTPIYNALAPGTTAEGLARQKEIHAVFSDLWGRYPFEATGAIIDRGNVGYALETATKANYDVGDDGVSPDEGTVVHEISHEWFGNAVTLSRWRDIWLNEGFANFSEWMFAERTGGATAAEAFREQYDAIPASSTFWARPPADLGGPEFLFSAPGYVRGGMTLQALRETIGDARFFGLMRRWYARYRYDNASTQDFIALAERVSGRQLDAFFDAWLFAPTRPPLPAPAAG